MPLLKNIYSKFTSELQVRPDDIDMNQHVHSSRYLDYVLAARFEQMERYYKMSMQTFIDDGLSWVVKKSHMEFIRPLQLNDQFHVTTNISSFYSRGVIIDFKINRKNICYKKLAIRSTFKSKANTYFEFVKHNFIFFIKTND